MDKELTTSKSDDEPVIDTDTDEAFEGNDLPAIAADSDQSSISRDARRKIEIYWEKKRLREQFDDFDESEFGF